MTTRTTFHLLISRRDLVLGHIRAYLAQRDPLALLSLAIVGSIVGLALGRALFLALIGTLPMSAPVLAATPPLPIILIATPAAAPTEAQIQVQDVSLTIPRAIVVYAAPDGAPLGAIEAGRGYDYVARSGADWIQVDIAGSGVVWVRSADLTGVPDLADLAPTATPIVVVEQRPAIQIAAPTLQPPDAPPAPSELEPAQQLERQQNIQDRLANDRGGSGKMAAPEFAPLSSDAGAAQWCAGAAAAGIARCVEEQP